MGRQSMALENVSKNLTKAEVDARAKAEAECLPARPKLKAPSWLVRDKVAKKYWDATLKRSADVDLLDLLDIDVLATYCSMLSRREDMQQGYENWKVANESMDADFFSKLNAVEKSILAYGEKLGLTPSGRVRLARQRAEASLAGQVDPMFGD